MPEGRRSNGLSCCAFFPAVVTENDGADFLARMSCSTGPGRTLGLRLPAERLNFAGLLLPPESDG